MNPPNYGQAANKDFWKMGSGMRFIDNIVMEVAGTEKKERAKELAILHVWINSQKGIVSRRNLVFLQPDFLLHKRWQLTLLRSLIYNMKRNGISSKSFQQRPMFRLNPLS